MLGSKDQRQFARIWNKMQDHLDADKYGTMLQETYPKSLAPAEMVLHGMREANVQGQDITEELLKLQQEYSI